MPSGLAFVGKTSNSIWQDFCRLYVIDRHSNKEFRRLSLTKRALLCAQHVYPILRGKLQTAWGNMKVWEEERTSALRPPIPVPIFVCAVGLARARGKVEKTSHSRHSIECDNETWQSGTKWDKVELLRMRHSDIALPGQFILYMRAACRNSDNVTEKSATIWRQPCNLYCWKTEMVGLVETDSCDWKWWLAVATISASLGDAEATHVWTIGVQTCRFTPASLRPGGQPCIIWCWC